MPLTRDTSKTQRYKKVKIKRKEKKITQRIKPKVEGWKSQQAEITEIENKHAVKRIYEAKSDCLKN